MATPPQLTQIAFGAPLDESTEDEILDPQVGFPVLTNVRQDKRGGVSKRLGCEALPDMMSRTEGRRVFSHKGRTCVIGGGILSAYSESLAESLSVGRVSPVMPRIIPLPASSNTSLATVYDAVVQNDFLIFVYAVAPTTDNNSVRCLVVRIDGDVAIPVYESDEFSSFNNESFVQIQLGTCSQSGTPLALLAIATASNNFIRAYSLDASSISSIQSGWTSIGDIATDRFLSLPLVMQALTNRVALAYIGDDGSSNPQLRVVTFDATGVLDSATHSTSSVLPNNIALAGRDSDQLWLSWDEGGDINLVGLDPANLGTTITAPTLLDSGELYPHYLPPRIVPDPYVAGAAMMISGEFRNIGSGIEIYTEFTHWTTLGGTLDEVSYHSQFGANIASEPWVENGRYYGLFAAGYFSDVYNYVGETRPPLVLADWTPANVVHGSYIERNFPPVATLGPNDVFSDPHSHAVVFSNGRRGHVIGTRSAGNTISFKLVQWDFQNESRLARPAAHNGSTFLSGGTLYCFDGAHVHEAGFVHEPRNIGVEAPMAAEPGPNGDVHYVAVFEHTDGAGNLSISGVSAPFAYSAGGFTVHPTCEPIVLTGKTGRVYVTFYRTTQNGSVYYQVDTRLAFNHGTPIKHIVAEDALDDATLLTRPRLYGTGLLPGTNSSLLQHDAPPYCRDVVSYNGMLVIASGTDLWWSGQTIGGEGTWFSTEQFFLTVDGPGDITALAVQDSILYAFKERSIYSVSGDPPADNGSSGGLGQPRLLSSDVGCINTNSVVTTSIGVFFQSHRGIELLGRGAPVWIGEKVQRTLERFPVVTSAVLDARNSLVRLSLASTLDDDGLVVPYDAESGAGGGRDLIFDLVLGDWQSVDDKSGASEHEASQDACVITINGKSKYAWLAADGTVYVERESTDAYPYRDPGGWITMTAETGWFKVGGLQGRQIFNRALLLARKHSPVNLSMSIGYTYGEYAEPREWTNDELDALLTSGWPITQLEHRGNNDSDGQSIRIRITDSSADFDGANGNGRGATWLGLTLDITPRSGAADVPEGAR